MSAIINLRQGWLEMHQCLCRQMHVIESGKASAVLSVEERASALQKLYALTAEYAALLADHPNLGESSTDDRTVVEWIASLDGSALARDAA